MWRIFITAGQVVTLMVFPNLGKGLNRMIDKDLREANQTQPPPPILSALSPLC